MQYAFLGRTGAQVSRISLGAAAFGVAPVAEDAIALVHRGLELGVNFIDTANAYGMSNRFDRPGAPKAGERPVSEEIIGNAIKGRRHEVILATKVSERVGEGPNTNGLSRVHIMQQIEQSLRRLQTDYVDVYYCHHTDPNTPIEETLDTFDVLIRQGKVIYCALSNFLGYETAEAVLKAEKLGLHAPVCVQNSYSFLDRRPETEVLPACRKFGLSFYGFSPVAGGLLGGASVLERRVAGRARWGGKPLGEDEARTIMWWDAAAKEAGVPPGQLALAWQLQKPGVTGVVIGPERVASLESSCAAVDLDLPSDLFDHLEESYAEAKAAGEA